jgi:hypothetical protein
VKIAANLVGFQLFPDALFCSLVSLAKKEVRHQWQVYASVRKLAVNASLRWLGVEQLNISDIHCLEWEARVVFVEMPQERFVLTVLTVYIMAPLTFNQPNKN